MSIANHGTAHHVETVIRGYRRAIKLNDVESAKQQFNSRSLHYHYDDDGSLVFNGRVPAEVGTMLIKASDKAVDRAKREEKTSGVSAETLKADVIAETSNSRPETETSHIEDGPHVSAETSKRLCCDTSISRFLEDEKGEPLSIERKSRVIPPATRRALKARDKGCRFPGCTHTD